MKQALIAAFLLGSVVSVPAHAADKPKANQPADRLICRDQDEIGSRLRTRRICMTKQQWDQARRDAQESVDLGQRRSAVTCPPNTVCS
jgi:hypothetical protein